MTAYVKWLAKGLTAGTAAVAVLVIVTAAGSDAGSTVTPNEWWQVVAAALGALGVVLIPNGPRPSTSEPA